MSSVPVLVLGSGLAAGAAKERGRAVKRARKEVVNFIVEAVGAGWDVG